MFSYIFGLYLGCYPPKSCEIKVLDWEKAAKDGDIAHSDSFYYNVHWGEVSSRTPHVLSHQDALQSEDV